MSHAKEADRAINPNSIDLGQAKMYVQNLKERIRRQHNESANATGAETPSA